MGEPVTDRRRDSRFGQPLIAAIRAVLRPGYLVSLVDLSAGGALIEGPRPLRPGARVHLQLVTGTRALGISGHILRCSVASLDADNGVRYRGALRFDHRCESLWESVTPDGNELPARAPIAGDGHGQLLPDSLPTDCEAGRS